jgi:hypothetical protein
MRRKQMSWLHVLHLLRIPRERKILFQCSVSHFSVIQQATFLLIYLFLIFLCRFFWDT